MANTLNNMQAQIFADSAILKFNSLLAPVTAFSKSFNPTSGQKGSTVRVPVFSTLTGGAFDNYTAGNETQTGVDITLDQHVNTKFHITDREAAESGADYFRDLGAQAGKATAKKVLETIMAQITAANYGNAAGDVLIKAAAEFDVKQVAALRAKMSAKGVPAVDAAIILQSDWYVALLQDTTLTAASFGTADAIQNGRIPTLFGFNGVYECSMIPTNSENLVGYVTAPQALGIAVRYLEPQSNTRYDEVGKVTDEESGLSLGIRIWFDPATGKRHYNCECLFGVKTLDGAALVRILSA